MALSLFATRPGVAVRLPEDIPAGMVLTIGGAGGNLATSGAGSFSSHVSIITELGIDRSGNYQILHSLDDFIYSYVFGERIGQVLVAGLSFADTCTGQEEDSSAPAQPGRKTGIEHILEYYEQSRIAATGRPYDLLLGTSADARLRGLLTDLRVRITRPEARIAEFALQFKSFSPRR